MPVWIRLYFKPEGAKFAYEIASCEFNAHGASTDGPDSSGIYTHHTMTVQFKTETAGELFATAFCNIHGLWESSKEIALA